MARALSYAVIVGVTVAATPSPLTAASAAAPGKCDTVPVVDFACEVGKTALGVAGKAATAPFRAAAGGAMDIVTSWVADSAQWLLTKVVGFIDSSTSPDLDAEWFRQRYDLIAGIALFVLLPILLAATIRALLAQDLRQLFKCYFLYLPGAIAGMFVAIQLTQTLLVLTDDLSAAVSGTVADDTGTIFRGVGRTVSLVSADDAPAPSFAIFMAALLLIVGAFFVWLELLVRSAAVTVAVFFLPLIFAGAVWPAAGARMARRVIETLFALIVSKFVIVGVISLATAAMADPGRGSFGTVMGAVALVAMAAFAPFAILKLIPVVESSAVHHVEALRYRHQSQLYHRSSTHHVVAIMRSRLARSSSSGGAGSLVRRPAAAAAGAVGTAGVAASSVRRVGGATASKADRAADHSATQTQTPSGHSQVSPPRPRIKKPPEE